MDWHCQQLNKNATVVLNARGSRKPGSVASFFEDPRKHFVHAFARRNAVSVVESLLQNDAEGKM